jgi:dUTP pyrophosphatase
MPGGDPNSFTHKGASLLETMSFIKLLCENEEVRQLYGPAPHSTQENSGFDLVLTEDTVFRAGAVTFVKFGVSAEAFKYSTRLRSHAPSAFWLAARSSLSKTPLMLANGIGLIDSTYRGQLIAALRNTHPSVDFEAKKGTRLVQIVLPNAKPFDVQFTSSLSDTKRGDGGFGSTGGCAAAP